MKAGEITPLLADITVYASGLENCLEAVKTDDEIPLDTIRAMKIYVIKLETRLQIIGGMLNRAEED